ASASSAKWHVTPLDRRTMVLTKGIGPVDVVLGAGGGRDRRPCRMRAVQIEVHREQAAEEHHLGGEEDVHAHHPGLDRWIFGGGLRLTHRGDGHQWCTSPCAGPLSEGYMRTSSTSTQPTTP